jgi:hypothetical protein
VGSNNGRLSNGSLVTVPSLTHISPLYTSLDQRRSLAAELHRVSAHAQPHNRATAQGVATAIVRAHGTRARDTKVRAPAIREAQLA